MEKKTKYPAFEKIRKASEKDLLLWWYYLPNPKNDIERRKINLIHSLTDDMDE